MPEMIQEILTVPNVAILFLAVISAVGFSVLASRMRKLQMENRALNNQYRSLQYEVKSLFDSATAVGKRIQSLEKRAGRLEDNQDELTLKEPSHQAYENAIRMIKSGQPIEEVVECSGLSRGELELLTLLRRVEDGEPLNLS